MLSLGSSMESMSAERGTALVGVRFSRRSNDRGARPSPFTVGRGPVPRRASIGTRNGLCRRAFFARIERSRGTGPRATVKTTCRITVGRGPSHATRACERVSLAMQIV